MVDCKLENITKIFGKDVIAVDDVTLHIEDQELLTLVGPSGCGKTTTLRIIAGLETPTSGNIYFGDQLVNDVEPKSRNVAMVFQSYALYPHMSVRDNIGFPLRFRKMPKTEVKKKVIETAELLMIGDLLDRKPRQLSGGQKQRVALGRAIVRQPNLFLLDEPLSNIDAKLRVTMRAEIQRLQRKLKTTTIYVTHDQLEAMTMSNRIAVMDLGKIQQLGPPDEVYNHPANKFTASFIGTPSINFIESTLTERDGVLVMESDCFAMNLPEDLREIVKTEATSEQVIVGIRPEDLSITKKHPKDSIPAKVYVIEPVGSEQFIHVTVDDKILIVRASADLKVEIDEEIRLICNKEKMRIFDSKTGKALI